MSGIFKKIPMPKLHFSKHDLSFTNTLTTEFGRLTPFLIEEVSPNTTLSLSNITFVRLQPMLAPIFHDIDLFTAYFYVPFRLIMNKEDLQNFFSGGKDGKTFPEFPKIPIFSSEVYFQPKSLADYLRVPTLDPRPVEPLVPGYDDAISALPFRAYQELFNNFFRDENLQDEITFSLDDGIIDDVEELDNLLTIRNVCWEKDYFTSALPFAQRGDEVSIPLLASTADIYLKDPTKLIESHLYQRVVSLSEKTLGLGQVRNNTSESLPPDVGRNVLSSFAADGTYPPSAIDPNGTLEARQIISNGTVRELRYAVAAQAVEESLARGGYRYKEVLASQWSVNSSDKLLDRPEFIGSSHSRVLVSEVLQQTQQLSDGDDATTPLGYMAGHGVSTNAGRTFKYFAEEHGFLIGLLWIRPKTGYMQGIPRFYHKFNRYDYLMPKLESIGEQEVYESELYYTGMQANATSLFGYQSRYAEYKFHENEVHGDFKDSLDYWHLARKFDSEPNLNAEFVTVQSEPLNRIFAVTSDDTDHFLVQVQQFTKAKLPISYYSIPRLI